MNGHCHAAKKSVNNATNKSTVDSTNKAKFRFRISSAVIILRRRGAIRGEKRGQVTLPGVSNVPLILVNLTHSSSKVC